MGTSLASMTACTCCWLPAVMLDRNHTASYRIRGKIASSSVTVSYSRVGQVYVNFIPTENKLILLQFTFILTAKDWVKRLFLRTKHCFVSELDQNRGSQTLRVWPLIETEGCGWGKGWCWGFNHRPGHYREASFVSDWSQMHSNISRDTWSSAPFGHQPIISYIQITCT